MHRSPLTLGHRQIRQSRTEVLWFAAVLLLAQALLPAFALAASKTGDPNRIQLCTPDGVQWVTFDREGKLTVLSDTATGIDHGDDCGVCIHGSQIKVLPTFDADLQAMAADGAVLFRLPKKLQAAASPGEDRIRAPPA